MERFGSSKLRIMWISLAILIAGLIIGGIKPADGGNLLVFGMPIPMGLVSTVVDPVVLYRGILTELIYTIVPLALLFASVLPVLESVRKESIPDTFKTLGYALINGLFYSQVLLLPISAASYRLVGHPLLGVLFLADINAILLGIQLMFWAMALTALIPSNPGLALLVVFGLKVLGKYMAWGGEFLGDPDLISVPSFLVKTMSFMGKLLPTGQVPSDSFSWTAMPLSIGGPLLLMVAFKLVSRGKGTASPTL